MAASSVLYYKNAGDSTYSEYDSDTVPDITYFGWTREGYTFSHWNTQSDDTGVTYAIGSTNPDYNLYAIWEEIQQLATNKVVFGGQTVVDLTQDTATEGTVLAGYTFHKADGQQTVGTYTPQAVSLQTKSATYTPATSQQTATITADSGYDGLSSVGITVNAMPSGTAGTPTATKGTVSNHAVSVTPSVTNTTGYITGGTKTGTAVSVSASELVSGTYSVTSSGTKDVTNYASASVPSGTEGTPTATKGTVSNHSVSVTPSVTNTTGFITGNTKTGTAVTVSASELVSGTLSITDNGTADVTNYASVDVNVSGGGGSNIVVTISKMISGYDRKFIPSSASATTDPDQPWLEYITIPANSMICLEFAGNPSSVLGVSGATYSLVFDPVGRTYYFAFIFLGTTNATVDC